MIPSLDTRFSGVDWILGNHSDELTPWIPVIAALSGQTHAFKTPWIHRSDSRLDTFNALRPPR